MQNTNDTVGLQMLQHITEQQSDESEKETALQLEAVISEKKDQEITAETVQCNRCGHCCQGFILPISPVNLKLNYQAAMRGDSTVWLIHENSGQLYKNRVNAMLATWYPALTSFAWDSSTRKSLFPDESFHPIMLEHGPSQHWYSCSHLQVEFPTNEPPIYSCGIFEIRPYPCNGFKPHQQKAPLKEEPNGNLLRESNRDGYLFSRNEIQHYSKCSYLPFLPEKDPRDVKTEETLKSLQGLEKSIEEALGQIHAMEKATE